jgi:hypothetical protein
MNPTHTRRKALDGCLPDGVYCENDFLAPHPALALQAVEGKPGKPHRLWIPDVNRDNG